MNLLKVSYFIWTCLIPAGLFAQLDVASRYENIENGYEFYVDNNEPIPVSIQVSFKLKNLKSSEGNDKIFLLPANTKNIKLTTLTQIKKGKYGVSGSATYNYGDHYLKDYEKEYPYVLPFNKGEAYMLSQGYNGKSSHANENALDFSMPIGTPILAVRGGLVVEVVDKFSKNCTTQDCKEFNNKVIIYHDDGTFAEYTHIKQKGAKVKKGDVVEKNQFIAESGNVGWSTGPHLHFVVFIQTLKGRKTLETKFKISDNQPIQFLTEKTEYKRL
ncbi:M23 family metallopeptidase [Bizionia sp.]|uniref:M23 family metallopeptidase n=1 Tax=Bizionia sp. TaxID=1954480 RepID=UPI003A929C5B